MAKQTNQCLKLTEFFYFLYTGKPAPSLVWLIEDEVLDNNTESSNENIVRNDVVLYEIKRSKMGSIFTCKAKYHPKYAPMLISATLEMYRKLKFIFFILLKNELHYFRACYVFLSPLLL